ncbi:MAG: diphthine--ammonia ligase [Dehalococcoidales bacterium]
MEKVLLSWSGGKDSVMSLYEIQNSGKYEIVSLLTTINKDYDRVSMHGVRRVLLEQQAHSLGLPMTKVLVPKDCSNEEYEARVGEVLSRCKQDGITQVVFGDIFLEWVKEYRENNLAKLGMKGVFPIWRRDTAELTRSFITLGFEAVITCVDTKLLAQRFLGRTLDEQFLADLPPTVDPNGENGEFHSFVFAGPIFKERIAYTLGKTVQRDSFYFCDLLPKEGMK